MNQAQATVHTTKTVGSIVTAIVFVIGIVFGSVSYLDSRAEARFYSATKGALMEQKLDDQAKAISKMESKLDTALNQNRDILIEIAKLGVKIDKINK
jgi:hypothetical protein